MINLDIVDGIKIMQKEKNGDVIIFNYYTWFQVIKGVMVEYANLTAEQAEKILMSSNLIKNQRPCYMSVALNAHATEYHWAMLLTYGEQYWLKGISSEEPEGYFEWEDCFRIKNNLEKYSFIFLSKNNEV